MTPRDVITVLAEFVTLLAFFAVCIWGLPLIAVGLGVVP